MKIDPCPCVISLKDGSVHTLFEFRHFLELVDQYMGYDVAKWLRTYMEQAENAADYTTAKIDSDLVAYESDLDSNRRAFQDIQTEAAAIMEPGEPSKDRPFRERNRKNYFQSDLGGKDHV